MKNENHIIQEGRFTLSDLQHYGASSYDLEQLEKLLKLPAGQRDCLIYFVGILETEEHTFYSLPKSFNKTDLNYNNMIILLSFLERMSQNKKIQSILPDIELFKPPSDKSSSSRLKLAQLLIEDYLNNGLLTFKSKDEHVSNQHAPSWSRTIDKMLPLHSPNSIIYDNWLTNKKVDIQDQNIKKIHQYVINQCLKRYGQLLAPSSQSYEMKELEAARLPNKPLTIINSKLRSLYVQRDVKVLLAIKQWLESNDAKNKAKGYGTQSFHILWEEACSFLFANKKDETHWKEAFIKPKWFYLDDNDSVFSDPFDVDIISEQVPDKLILADAKYYDISKRQRGILGVSDLAKQVNYETQLVKSSAYKDNYCDPRKLSNLFLFPASTDINFSSKLCEIEFPNLSDKKLTGYALNTVEVMKRFTQKQELCRDELLVFTA